MFRQNHFNMRDSTVGGYEPTQVALRRAIALGMDCEREIRLVHCGQGTVSHTVLAPCQWGFDASLRSEMVHYDPVRARGLLDVCGYLDRNGDGWRERPDGSPLVLEMAAQNAQRDRAINEGFDRDMRALGLRLKLHIGEFLENSKATLAGKVMMQSLDC